MGVGGSEADVFRRLLSDFADSERPRAGPTETDSTQGFDELLRPFATESGTNGDSLDQIRVLLRDFESVRKVAIDKDVQDVSSLATAARSLLDHFAVAWTSWCHEQARSADYFNILGIFNLLDDEVRHSMALQWLLSSDLHGRGTHAQGALGFQLFLEEAGLPTDYAKLPYRVSREVSGDSARIDLEIASRGNFLIHIENKIWSSEGSDQTPREWKDLRRRADELGVPRDDEASVVGYYLTPDGATPSAPEFKTLRWGQIARIFSRFADLAIPTDVRLFSRHFSSVLRRFSASEGRRTGENE